MCVCAEMQVPKLAMLSSSLDHGGMFCGSAVSAIDVRSENMVWKGAELDSLSSTFHQKQAGSICRDGLIRRYGMEF